MIGGKRWRHLEEHHAAAHGSEGSAHVRGRPGQTPLGEVMVMVIVGMVRDGLGRCVWGWYHHEDVSCYTTC